MAEATIRRFNWNNCYENEDWDDHVTVFMDGYTFTLPKPPGKEIWVRRIRIDPTRRFRNQPLLQITLTRLDDGQAAHY